ncbi:hypothetical protein Dxin01_01119 [Deinococcus xinjiangensis]|uniref:Dienelactone hydrolase domain-containing protein n=2 Tax=Deinococcus xinjiangensis TaxID=457454 RepID=A0ABP9V7Y4_9DEIO
MDAFLALPAEGKPLGGMIVGMEIFGVTPFVRRVATRLAELGYAALAPNFFYRYAPELQLERDQSGRERGLALTAQLQRQEVLRDVQASINELKGRGCAEVGMLGLSMGGHLAYLAAAELPLRAVAVLYGGWLAGSPLIFAGGPPTLDLTPKMAQQNPFLLYLVGEADHVVPPSDQQSLREALQAAVVRHEVVVYPDAPHGFFSDDAETFRPAIQADAWARIEAMLRRELARQQP